jgi:hypothetical protein
MYSPMVAQTFQHIDLPQQKSAPPPPLKTWWRKVAQSRVAQTNFSLTTSSLYGCATLCFYHQGGAEGGAGYFPRFWLFENTRQNFCLALSFYSLGRIPARLDRAGSWR